VTLSHNIKKKLSKLFTYKKYDSKYCGHCGTIPTRHYVCESCLDKMEIALTNKPSKEALPYD